jgi:hypothetical protein
LQRNFVRTTTSGTHVIQQNHFAWSNRDVAVTLSEPSLVVASLAIACFLPKGAALWAICWGVLVCHGWCSSGNNHSSILRTWFESAEVSPKLLSRMPTGWLTFTKSWTESEVVHEMLR